MFMHHSLYAVFFMLLPIGIAQATGGASNDQNFKNITTIRKSIDPSVQFVSKPFPVQVGEEGQLSALPHQSSTSMRRRIAEHVNAVLPVVQEERPASPESPGYVSRVYVKGLR